MNGTTRRHPARSTRTQKATGGGFTSAILDPTDDVVVKDSQPLTLAGEPVGWTATFTNNSTLDERANAIAICIA